MCENILANICWSLLYRVRAWDILNISHGTESLIGIHLHSYNMIISENHHLKQKVMTGAHHFILLPGEAIWLRFNCCWIRVLIWQQRIGMETLLFIMLPNKDMLGIHLYSCMNKVSYTNTNYITLKAIELYVIGILWILYIHWSYSIKN